MASMARIELAGMATLVNQMVSAAGELPFDQYGLRSALQPVDVDSSPADRLSRVIAWAQDAVPGLRRRLALAQAIEAQQPGRQFTVSIDETLISTEPPWQAHDDGVALAKRMLDGNGAVDPKLIAELQAHANDPYFAQGFASTLTPAQLADIVRRESGQHDAVALQYPNDPDRRDAWSHTYQGLLTALGDTIGTATRNTGDLALPSDYGTQWARAITEEPPSEGGHGYYGQASDLAMILRQGAYGTDFLDTVAGQVLDYERSANLSGMWHQRSWPTSDSFQGAYTPDGKQLSDPLVGIMSALSRNPVAAQRFFDGGGTQDITVNGTKVPVNSRMKYLIDDRTWADDLGSDNGDAVGAALQTATTYFRDMSAQGQLAAKIAGQTFALIGSNTGHGASDGGWFGIGSHQGWKMSDGMRAHVANMIASYSPDLVRIVGSDDPSATDWDGSWVVSDPANTLFPPNGPASAWMDPELMKKIIGTLGEDPKNLDIVNTGVAVAGRIMLDYALQRGLGDPHAPVDVIQGGTSVPGVDGATYALAHALNFVIDSGYHGDKNQQAFEAARAANIAKVLSLVSSVPGLELPEGHAIASWAIDQAKDAALDKIGEGPDQDAQSTYNDTSSDYQTKLQQLTLNALLSNGYLSDAHYRTANEGRPNQPFVSPYDPRYADQDPPAVSIGSDGTPHFNFDSRAYHDWLQTGSVGTVWVATRVTTPFRDNLPAYGG